MNIDRKLQAAGAALAGVGYIGAAVASNHLARRPADQSACVDPDDADAAELSEAAYILGVHYAEAGNMHAAARWLRTAAHRDVGDAALRLALVLQALDDPQAQHWFAAAADAGYAAADADQLDAPDLPLTCCPSPADQDIAADALNRAEETVRAACAQAERIVAAAREEAHAITTAAQRQAGVALTTRCTAGQEWSLPPALRLIDLALDQGGGPKSIWSGTSFAVPRIAQQIAANCTATNPDEDHHASLRSLWYYLANETPLAVRSTCGAPPDADRGADWLILYTDSPRMAAQAKGQRLLKLGAPRVHGDLHSGNVLIADASTLNWLLAEDHDEVLSVSTKVSHIRPGASTPNNRNEDRTEVAEFEFLMPVPAA
jgi:hypothetical protein